jgi:sugar phosphate isomerase/epimerase
MSREKVGTRPSGRREFIVGAGAAGIATAGAVLAPATPAAARPLSDQEKHDRLASNTWPLRSLFKRREDGREPSEETLAMRKKYGEITMLDFPQFTKDHFEGVRHMDLWSSLFGDTSDDSMFSERTFTRGERTRTSYEFDPGTASAKAWLGRLAESQVKAGVQCHHVSNNAPRDLSDLDPEKRRQGIAVGKVWLDASAQLGAKSMRVNTGGPRVAPSATADSGYPRNDEVVKYLAAGIESFKELADYGSKVGVKVTIENHWGLSADPMLVRIILDEVGSPFCEASPDFCNWEHEYMLYHGLKALAPYTHTTVHAKYWDRWEKVDVRRCVRIMMDAGFEGKFALEYEDGPWDGMQGAKYLYDEVLAAL